MKSLTPVLLSVWMMAVSCSQPQPYSVSMASTTQQVPSCNPSLPGPLTYEQYFPEARHISQFVRRIHEDSHGNMWFGTNGDGVIRYDGDTLQYFSFQQGFDGAAVRGIVEDEKGNLWFGTENGLIKYNPTAPDRFVTFNTRDGLIHNDIWSLHIDREGMIWVGTLRGVSKFDGVQFSEFVLPETQIDPTRGVTSTRIVHSIMQDSRGRMWFGTNGGAFIYEGNSLSNISEKDGLCGNMVNAILEDKEGNFWFATHHHGVCRWDGTSFTSFGENRGVEGSEVWSLTEDSNGHIWFPVEGYGVYQYDGEHFSQHYIRQGLSSRAIQCIYEDREGTLWCGGYMGLFRLDYGHFQNIGKKGPWDDGC